MLCWYATLASSKIQCPLLKPPSTGRPVRKRRGISIGSDGKVGRWLRFPCPRKRFILFWRDCIHVMSDATTAQVPTCPSKQVEDMRSSANPELFTALQKVWPFAFAHWRQVKRLPTALWISPHMDETRFIESIFTPWCTGNQQVWFISLCRASLYWFRWALQYEVLDSTVLLCLHRWPLARYSCKVRLWPKDQHWFSHVSHPDEV